MNLKRTFVLLFAGYLSFGVSAYTDEELIELSALFMQAVDPQPQASSLRSAAQMSSFSTGGGPSPIKLMTELALSRMDVKEQITPETTALFGDKVDLNMGAITFQHKDISLKGNNDPYQHFWTPC